MKVSPESVKPLDRVEVACMEQGTVSVRDALGREYVRRPAGAVARTEAGPLAHEGPLCR